MFNNIISSICGLLNIFGTIYAVLSILRIGPKELFAYVSIDGIVNQDKSMLKQSEQARIGISYILLGFIIDVIYRFVEVRSINTFVLILGAILILSAAVYIINKIATYKLKNAYKKYEEDLAKKKQENTL